MLRPLQDNVLLAQEVAKEKMESGLYRPGTVAGARYQKAKVLAVGPGKLSPSGKWEEVKVKKNDIVVYDSNYSVDLDETTVTGARLLLCVERGLLAVVE